MLAGALVAPAFAQLPGFNIQLPTGHRIDNNGVTGPQTGGNSGSSPGGSSSSSSSRPKWLTIHAGDEWSPVFAKYSPNVYPGVAGSVNELNQRMGWGEGKVSVVVDMPPGSSDTYQMRSTFERIGDVTSPLRWDNVAHPRGDHMLLTIKFDPACHKGHGTVSADGSTYNFVLPAYAMMSTDDISAVYKKGHK
jgi:hypothetical protein